MSLASVLTMLSGITVSGVKRTYAYQPSQINAADMPCMIPAQPTLRGNVVTFSGDSGLRTYTVTMVLIVEPSQANTPPAKWAKSVALMDALDDALADVADSWALRLEETALGGGDNETTYWAIIAEVEVMA